jgi:hypothetical protein
MRPPPKGSSLLESTWDVHCTVCEPDYHSCIQGCIQDVVRLENDRDYVTIRAKFANAAIKRRRTAYAPCTIFSPVGGKSQYSSLHGRRTWPHSAEFSIEKRSHAATCGHMQIVFLMEILYTHSTICKNPTRTFFRVMEKTYSISTFRNSAFSR